MKIKLIFLFLIILPGTLLSQNSNIGNWLIYFGDKKIKADWNWHHEVQHRNYNGIGDLEQLLLRTGIGYNLTDNNNNLLLGYAYIHSQNYTSASEDKFEINEHRIYQQFITRQNFGRVFIQHRYRFEQRFFADDFRLRFRYFLVLNVPINNKSMLDETFYLSFYNEIFLNPEENNVFDRNRLYGGLGFKINDKVRVEAGYMNQFLTNADRDQINIITFINF
jgi:hypothetical protein